MHQTIMPVLKALLHSRLLQTPQDILHLIDDTLTDTIYSTRYAILMVSEASPGALSFLCYMLLNIPLFAGCKPLIAIEKHY